MMVEWFSTETPRGVADNRRKQEMEMERDYADLKKRYELVDSIENKVEQAVNRQIIELELQLGYFVQVLAKNRLTLKYSLDNGSDCESLQGWLNNLKREEDHVKTLNEKIVMLQHIASAGKEKS